MVREQNFKHQLDMLRGWPGADMNALMAVGKLDPTVTAAAALNGRCYHKDSTSGKWKLGAEGNEVPIFCHHNIFDEDVSIDFSSPETGYVSGIPASIDDDEGVDISGLVATGGFELSTTEYDPNAAFTYNDALHSPSEATCSDNTEAGKLYKELDWTGGAGTALVPYKTHNVCGFVSEKVAENQHGIDVLTFYTHFLPAYPDSFT